MLVYSKGDKDKNKLIRTHSALKEKKIMTFVGFGII